ncbi:hypothetical protein JB92DRAFT_2847599 [Gautieria morchelliformis]|nr:hypothetical protein JB92DRAFT_2847599 [Gautieria morchelliformis]
MLSSKKRRLSVSPERSHQPQDTPQPKKRKLSTVVSNEANTAGPSHPPVALSPEPAPSDSSVTLDGDSPPARDKGKGKAVEQDPIMVELEQLRREVAEKNELLKKNEMTNAAVLQTLSCHVCLDTMCLPYALSPCGHMACQTCLVNWFTSSHNDNDNDAENPHIDWYSDEGSDNEADVPNPTAGPGANGAPAVVPNANGNGPLLPPAAPGGNGPPPPPAAPANGLPAAAHPPFPNTTNRRKTCPHCRGVVRQRPIQIYPVKDLLAILAPRPELEAQAIPKKDSRSDPNDPWKGIFRSGPIYHDSDDSDDNGPWPGMEFVGGLGPNPPIPPEHPDPQLPPPPPPLLPQPPPPFIDLEDGVRRCGACMHEVWGGGCTNAGCGVAYSDQSDTSDDGVDLVGDVWYAWDENVEDAIVPIQPNPEAANGDDEDGYESSFIDDDAGGDDHGGLLHRLRHGIWPGGGRTTADPEELVDEDDFLPGPSRRLIGRRHETIVISSDSDDDGVDNYMPRKAGRGRPRQIIDVDEEDEEEEEEQEVEGDVRSADESHSNIQIGASDFVSEHQFTEPSGVPYYEEDEEYHGNGEVPYIWEENSDDEGEGCEKEDHADGHHRQDEDEDDDDEEGYES